MNALVVLIANYLLPLPQPVREVLAIMDGLNAAIFFLDFVALMIIGVSAFLVLTSFIVSTSADLNRIGGFSCPLDL